MRDVIKNVRVFCPYCHSENRYLANKEGLTLVSCDPDNGGCGRPFVVDYRFSVEVEIFRLEPVSICCWYCEGLRPNDDGNCPFCDKVADPNMQEVSQWTVCPRCGSYRVGPVAFNPRNYLCRGCGADYYPESPPYTDLDIVGDQPIPF